MKRGNWLALGTGMILIFNAAPLLAAAPALAGALPASRFHAPTTGLPDWFAMGSVALLLCAANVGVFLLAVAMNFRKSLAFELADAWEDPRYARVLPNVLALLKQRGFATPWPRHCTPWSMHAFERRLRKTLRPLLRRRAGAFIEQHISVWIWVESHRDECKKVLRSRQVELALEFLASTRIPGERAGAIAFLGLPGLHGTAEMDEKTAAKLALLRRLQVIMREHGYNIAPEFGETDLLEQTPREDLLEVLPPRRFAR